MLIWTVLVSLQGLCEDIYWTRRNLVFSAPTLCNVWSSVRLKSQLNIVVNLCNYNNKWTQSSVPCIRENARNYFYANKCSKMTPATLMHLQIYKYLLYNSLYIYIHLDMYIYMYRYMHGRGFTRIEFREVIWSYFLWPAEFENLAEDTSIVPPKKLNLLVALSITRQL